MVIRLFNQFIDLKLIVGRSKPTHDPYPLRIDLTTITKSTRNNRIFELERLKAKQRQNTTVVDLIPPKWYFEMRVHFKEKYGTKGEEILYVTSGKCKGICF